MAGLYNRYIPNGNGYVRVSVDDAPNEGGERRKAPHSAAAEKLRPNRGQTRRISAGEDKNAGIAGILNMLHLEDLDSGDILLLLIILFLFLEGDNLELVITLGLMLLLGLGDAKKETQNE